MAAFQREEEKQRGRLPMRRAGLTKPSASHEKDSSLPVITSVITVPPINNTGFIINPSTKDYWCSLALAAGKPALQNSVTCH